MKTFVAIFVVLISSFSPAFAQTQIDAATRQDVEDLMQLTGVRDRMQTIYSAMAGQFAASFVDRYRKEHPSADPAEVERATTAAAERFQQLFKAMPINDLIDAMVPVYQKYLTHSDIKAINEFYGSPTGQKLLQNSNAMMIEAMQSAQVVIKEHMAEIEAQVEKTTPDAAQTTPAEPR
jgi:uncharacterized protein